MKLPTEVKTRHKIRDLEIIKMYSQGKTQEEIGFRFSISGTRVHQLLYANLHLLELNKNFEKIKRINRFRRLHSQVEGVLNKDRDEIDVLEQLRKEVEGDSKTQPSPVNIAIINVKNLIALPQGELIDLYTRSLSQNNQ